MKPILFLFLLFLFLYVSIAVVLYFLQERIIYQPFHLDGGRAYRFDGKWEEKWLTTSDGLKLNALFFPAGGQARGVVLYLHGNRGNLLRWAAHHEDFTRHGYDFLVIDYRGFGKSEGRPSEAGLYEDAETAYRWLTSRYPPERIVLYGRSLGSGVAAHLAARHPIKMLILETPFDNMPNVIRAHVRLPLPAFLFRQNFPNAQNLKALRCPAYIFAGTQDRVVPYQLSARLQPLLPGPEHFVSIEGGGHRNLSEFSEYHHQLERLLGQG